MDNVGGISTISAHGRALKHGRRLRVGGLAHISTISAHGRALKPAGCQEVCHRSSEFQQFRLTVEH